MATILNAPRGAEPPPSPEVVEDLSERFAPEQKLTQLVDEVREATGIELAQSDDGALMFALTSGEQIRCEVQDRYQMLFTVTVMPLDEAAVRLAAPALLNANAFGRVTRGGWLGWDFATGSLLYHYVWNDFAIGSTEAFLTLVRLLVDHAGLLRTSLKEGALDQAIEQARSLLKPDV